MIGNVSKVEDEIDEAEVDDDVDDSEVEYSDDNSVLVTRENADDDSSDESVVSLNDKVQETIEVPKKKNQFHQKLDMKKKNKKSGLSNSSKMKKNSNKNDRKASWADI